MLAAASFDSTISIYDFSENDFTCVNLLEGHESEVKYIDWSLNMSWFVTCGRDKSIWVWEYNDSFEFYCLSIINGHEQDIKKCKFLNNYD